jgi:heat shock protein HtpX
MAIQFWQAQRKAKVRTWLYVTTFVILTLVVASLSELALRYFAGPENYDPPYPYFGLLFMAITFLTASYQYMSFSLYGGRAIAESLGGQEVDPNTSDQRERQLINIVEEMSIASGVKMPEVFILNCKQINAFAAGLSSDKAAIAVTKGALYRLTRDELQGVIGHEFSHLLNDDTKISTRLAAMVMGFFIISIIGTRLLEGSFFIGGSKRDDNNGGGGGNGGQIIALAGLIFMIAGIITWFAGSILKSFISREREYLADASAVQFTRNPEGLIGALKKIGESEERDMPKSGMAFSHLYFDDRSIWSTLFSTHPPLDKRIRVLEGELR